jgi:hypothetical protein
MSSTNTSSSSGLGWTELDGECVYRFNSDPRVRPELSDDHYDVAIVLNDVAPYGTGSKVGQVGSGRVFVRDGCFFIRPTWHNHLGISPAALSRLRMVPVASAGTVDGHLVDYRVLYVKLTM